MHESKRFFREAKALKAFVVGVMSLCIGLVAWKEMDRLGHICWLIFTPFAFIMALLFYRSSKSPHRKHRIREPGIQRRNPPTVLPPRRD
jgi:hypothetical protein